MSSPVRTAFSDVPDAPDEGQRVRRESGDSYGQILKSSAIIGGSSIVNIVVSIVRAKAMALMLGPGGVGLLGLYSSVLDLTRSVAGMGINSSGVRQIAAAVGSGDAHRTARTATVLRRTALLLGLLGAVLLAAFSAQVSLRTFGNADFAGPIALLAVAVFFGAVSDGQRALIQGMRRIADLASISVVTAVVGSSLTLALVYAFRERAVVPSLVAGTVVTLAISWWYRRKIPVPTASVTFSEVREETWGLLSLGVAFMATAVLSAGAAYAIRIIVRDASGLEAAGLYQSAWSIGGMYVGVILQAMGSDFYPRLTAVADDDAQCNRLVNEQAEIGMLLAGPGVIGTLTLAPLVITLFYSTRFGAAVEPLRWICLGMALRVVAWPLGYIILAKGERKVFFWTEVAATIVHVGLALLLVRYFGLAGAAAAFFGLYVWHSVLIYTVVRRRTGFGWSPANRRLGMMFLPLVAAVFAGFFVLPSWQATIFGLLAALVSGIVSLRSLCRLVSLDRVPRAARVALERVGIAPRLVCNQAAG